MEMSIMEWFKSVQWSPPIHKDRDKKTVKDSEKLNTEGTNTHNFTSHQWLKPTKKMKTQYFKEYKREQTQQNKTKKQLKKKI